MTPPQMSPHTGAPAAFNRLKTCRYGQMVYNINDLYVGKSLDLYGEFSEAEVELFRQILRPGNVVLDIGANIGTHTLFFARHVGPTGRVLAFEPQRIVFQTLCANLALNSIPNVWCYPHAVGAEPGQIVVPALDYNQTNNYGGLGLGDHKDGEAVPVVRIDDLPLPGCHLLKIDVEGMERIVLSGAVKTLERFKPFLYVENDRTDRSTELIRYIDSLEYAMYWHHPPLFNAKNYFGNPTNVFQNIVSVNMFCVHKMSTIQLNGFQRVDVPQ